MQLIDEWKKWYTMYSIWAFALVGIAPDIYNLAVQYNLVNSAEAPVELARIINIIAFLGALSRLLKQKKLELEVERIAAAQAAAQGEAADPKP